MTDFLRTYISVMVASVVFGFIGAIPGTVPLMWLVALVHEHVYAGITPAGYGNLFLIDWILSYWTCALMLGINRLRGDS